MTSMGPRVYTGGGEGGSHKPLSKSGGSSPAYQVPKGPIRLRPLVTAMKEGGDITVELVLWVTY